MSNPNSFMHVYTATIQQFCDLIQNLRGFNDLIDQDPTLIDRYFSQPPSGAVRDDINAEDVSNAHDAINQVIYAFDSGNPTQKSLIFKMLP